ncbi:hypothetical protein [Halobacillus halophilus]|uniref:hypothetical protein n=1 Tax=Halobacillus halophilus TaxID=1570 RepID=UPI001CD4FB1D|nr:hypothetical protein [Halobacillus halophilus]MCA1009736.1 hypothetical protein [Halobacillus halophilus]
MKWLLAILLSGTLFVAGSLYGIEKNQEKEKEHAPIVQEKETEESPVVHPCSPPETTEAIPFIVKVAAGIGEGVAASFNGIILVLAEFIHSNPGSS